MIFFFTHSGGSVGPFRTVDFMKPHLLFDNENNKRGGGDSRVGEYKRGSLLSGLRVVCV